MVALRHRSIGPENHTWLACEAWWLKVDARVPVKVGSPEPAMSRLVARGRLAGWQLGLVAQADVQTRTSGLEGRSTTGSRTRLGGGRWVPPSIWGFVLFPFKAPLPPGGPRWELPGPACLLWHVFPSKSGIGVQFKSPRGFLPPTFGHFWLHGSIGRSGQHVPAMQG